MTIARTEAKRQSDRVAFRMPLEASWLTAEGVVLKRSAHTFLVSRNGGVLRLPDKLLQGHELTLHRTLDSGDTASVRACIVAEIDREPEGFLYAFHILDHGHDFWGIEFPSLNRAEEAIARLLMECSFCQRREVVYLNELELKSFEIRKAVARICKICDAPSIWVEVHTEANAANAVPAGAPRDDRILPRRNRSRVRARVLACIRRRGFQEEVAVCEDLSKGGIAFRSRNQYPEGTKLDVAVPYTPGGGAVFVPIRIVFCQPIPSAGLFRHGAAYLRPPE